MAAITSQPEPSIERRDTERRQDERRDPAGTSNNQNLTVAILNAGFILGLQLLIIFIICS